MVLDLKFCKFDDTPWGFRLVGGADFEIPLTVTKVAEESLAEQAGMKEGDVIVRINDIAASTLTHMEVHKVILSAGNNFMLGVIRSEIPMNEEDQTLSTTPPLVNEPTENIVTPILKSPISVTDDIAEETSEQMRFENDSVAGSEVSDELIAEMISSEAEVLKEHNNVLGVNFKKIIPQATICKNSEVFKTLNDEAVKTKEEKIKEERKWTTFLQKPNRPVPKSKFEMEFEKRDVYKVKIVKQPKPKVAPDRVPTPPPIISEPEPEPEPESIEVLSSSEPHNGDDLNREPCDNEMPNLETIDHENHGESVEDEITEEVDNSSRFEDIYENVENSKAADEEQIPTELEQQLAEVQRQLLALSNLPSAIQATLDAVTQQLAKLVPIVTGEGEPVVHEDKLEENVATCNDQSELIENEPRTEEIDDSQSVHEDSQHTEEQEIETDKSTTTEITANEPTEPPPSPEPTAEELEYQRLQEEQRRHEQEWEYKKQKELEEEHKQRLIAQRTPRRPPKAFGPLVPQERPLVLPGGRRWRNARDAYNDEFIAEVLSSQAELIVGTTLGNTFESPLLPYDERSKSGTTFGVAPMKRNFTESNCGFVGRNIDDFSTKVNFLKYKKPEKKVDLQNSDVYRLVHHMDKEPRRGIEVRPERVLTEDDMRRCATPISYGQ